MKRVGWAIGAWCMAVLQVAGAQVVVLDRARLPQDAAVAKAVDDVAAIEGYARTYEMNWRFPVARAEVASKLKTDLAVLEQAQGHSANPELQLLTGLVAYLAYNLDDDKAYDVAMKLLGELAGKDFRAAWFLGIHQCESNNTSGGMERLLGVEAAQKKLPKEFWQDYANCAAVSFLPVHAVRAYDLADRLNGGTPVDAALEELARKRIKHGANDSTYTNHEAWFAVESAGKVRFTSPLCGEAFTAKATMHLQLPDVVNGACSVVVEDDVYSTRTGQSSASFAVVSTPAKPGETLETFAAGRLNKPEYADRKPLAGVPCPVERCIVYEIMNGAMYSAQGGARLIAVFFASEGPQYPGLRFEKPVALPKSDSKGSGGPTFYHPEEVLGRLPGTRFSQAILDANADIYDRSRVDFEAFLKTLVVETKEPSTEFGKP